MAVDAGAEASEPITAEGTVTSGAVSAHAQAITEIEGDAPLQVVVAAGPNPVEPTEALLVSVTVTNRGLVELTGVVAAVRMPAELTAFGAGFASDAAACSGGICDFPERVVWNLGTLPAGQGVTV